MEGVEPRQLSAAEVPEAERPERIEWVLGVLPMIHEFFDQRAGSLSGGQGIAAVFEGV